MSERFIVIPNWDEFQHYKGQVRPAWIKLYPQLLHKDEFLDLTPEQRSALFGIWMLYAESARKVSESTSKLSHQLGQRITKPMLDSLNHAGFIEFSSRDGLETLYSREEKSREELPPSVIEQPQTGTDGRKEVIDVIVETDDNGRVIDLREILKEVG